MWIAQKLLADPLNRGRQEEPGVHSAPIPGSKGVEVIWVPDLEHLSVRLAHLG